MGAMTASPVAHFDFHEGSGPTTTSLVGGYVMNVFSWVEHSALGPIGPAGTVHDWTWAIDFTLDAIAPDGAICQTAGDYFFLNTNAGRPGPYPNYVADQLPLGTAVMLVVAVTATDCIVYVGGVEKGSFPGSYAMDPSQFKVQVDSHPPGVVHSLRYWDSVLSAADVAALSGPPVQPPTPPTVLAFSLETVTVTPSGGGFDSDGNWIEGGQPIEISTLAVAPGNTTLAAIKGGDTDVADFTVYLELGSPITDDDTIVVRGRECHARVKEWRSPYTGRGGLEVVCTSATGTSNG